MIKFLQKYFFIFVYVINYATSIAQTDSTYFQLPQNKKESKKQSSFQLSDKITFGGNFAFFTSNSSTFVDISPLIGYKLTNFILVGAGPVYNYYSEYQYGTRFTFDIYGVRAMGRIYFLESLFFQTGWDLLNRSIYVYNFNVLQKDRIWVQNIWIGGGVRYIIGSNAYMFTSILFNLNQNNYSPYPNPYIQIGFITGI